MVPAHNKLLVEWVYSDRLPQNVYFYNGEVFVECANCRDEIPIDDPTWLEGLTSDDDFIHYCGKSQYCCP